jgi:hypothetical protein
MLVEHDEIVEEPHRGAQGRESHFFMQRQTGRAVEMIHFQDAAAFFAQCGRSDDQSNQQRSSRCKPRQLPDHLPPHH